MKIDAKELRIGNLVRVNNPKYHPKLKGVILEVTSISETIDLDRKLTYSIGLKHINQKPNTYYETYSQFIYFIEPIKLTTKMLVKNFGFKKRDCWFYVGELNELLLRELDLVLCTDDMVISYKNYLHPILTVHHLQNLYASNNNFKELAYKF